MSYKKIDLNATEEGKAIIKYTDKAEIAMEHLKDALEELQESLESKLEENKQEYYDQSEEHMTDDSRDAAGIEDYEDTEEGSDERERLDDIETMIDELDELKDKIYDAVLWDSDVFEDPWK